MEDEERGPEERMVVRKATGKEDRRRERKKQREINSETKILSEKERERDEISTKIDKLGVVRENKSRS